MSERKNILITGASGFIGGHVAHYFVNHPVNVYCLVHPDTRATFIKDLPVKVIFGDVTDPEGLREQFAGMDIIIHTAALVGDWGRYEDFYAVNVEGTINVMKAALQNGITRLIITGSATSYGEENSRVLKDETFPFNPNYKYLFHQFFPSAMNHYRETKALSTREAMDFAGRHGMDLTILEPVKVYGENESGTGFFEYLKAVSTGKFIMPGSRNNTFHVIYAKELARAYWLAYQKGLKGIHRIIIGNEQPQSMLRIYQLLCREAGLKPPVIIPRPLIYPIGLGAEVLYTTLKRTKPPLLTRSRVNMFYDSIGYKTEKADQLLSFRNQVSLETGIRNTVRWYLANRWL